MFRSRRLTSICTSLSVFIRTSNGQCQVRLLHSAFSPLIVDPARQGTSSYHLNFGFTVLLASSRKHPRNLTTKIQIDDAAERELRRLLSEVVKYAGKYDTRLLLHMWRPFYPSQSLAEAQKALDEFQKAFQRKELVEAYPEDDKIDHDPVASINKFFDAHPKWKHDDVRVFWKQDGWRHHQMQSYIVSSFQVCSFTEALFINYSNAFTGNRNLLAARSRRFTASSRRQGQW